MSIITPDTKSQEAMQAKTQAIPPKVREEISPLPSGGTEGQVLTMGETEAEWDDIPSQLPEGGTPGQVLTMGASVPDVPEWADVPTELPDGGTAGQVLTVNAGATGVEWKDAPKDSITGFAATYTKISMSCSNYKPVALGKLNSANMTVQLSGSVTVKKSHVNTELTPVRFCNNSGNYFGGPLNAINGSDYTPTTSGAITLGDVSKKFVAMASLYDFLTAVGTLYVECEYRVANNGIRFFVTGGYIVWNAAVNADTTLTVTSASTTPGNVLVTGYDADGKLCEGTVLEDNGSWSTMRGESQYIIGA